ATSRHKSFSIRPVGPIVPVSCPPWPASTTIRLIFNPSARVKVDCPSRVGNGAEVGCTKSGFFPPFAEPNVRFGSGIVAAAGAAFASVFADFALEVVVTGCGLSVTALLAGGFDHGAEALAVSAAGGVFACAVCTGGAGLSSA